MKATGIVRKVDELGRIVLPIELRRTLNIHHEDPIEISWTANTSCSRNTSLPAFSAEMQKMS